MPRPGHFQQSTANRKENQHMLVQIMADEEEHADDMKDLLG
jgi:bacterioferritin (cytochrome b1)